jgi:hypothetical protein
MMEGSGFRAVKIITNLDPDDPKTYASGTLLEPQQNSWQKSNL